jgi:peptide/nickel transport system substrate-binding protein
VATNGQETGRTRPRCAAVLEFARKLVLSCHSCTEFSSANFLAGRSAFDRTLVTRPARNLAIIAAVALAVAAAAGVSRWSGRPSQPNATARIAARGGEIVASVHTDPRTFNRMLARDSTTHLVATLTHAKLVRLNRVTQEVEPWLAESWTHSSDGLSYTLKLRPNVTFSDGQPFTSDDVVFSFEAVYDEKVGSILADGLRVGGKKLHVAALDPLSVIVTFPEPFAPSLRLLDGLPIFPRHKLGSALKDGTFARAWGVGTPPRELVGLGPFVVADYQPGQRLIFDRNPQYWRKDTNGEALPYLDRVVLEIIPDQDTELLRLEAGQLDMTAAEMRPEDYAPLKRAADAGRLRILDLGVGFDADSLWFNLKPGGLPKQDPRAAWLQDDALRQAISLGVNRELFANTVFLGAGVPVYGPITPANKKWFVARAPAMPHDQAQAQAQAKRLLGSIGLADRDNDGVLEDAKGGSARFALITQAGNTSLERGAAVIREELKRIGLLVDVVALEGGALIQRFLSGNYEAVYFRVAGTDSDPAANPDFWLSSGTAHVWNLEQAAPATEWERRIDELTRRQSGSFDEEERRRLFQEIQEIFAERQPTIQFVAPRIYVAVSTRVTNLMPTAFSRPQLLWAPDTIAVVQ